MADFEKKISKRTQHCRLLVQMATRPVCWTREYTKNAFAPGLCLDPNGELTLLPRASTEFQICIAGGRKWKKEDRKGRQEREEKVKLMSNM